MKMNKKIMIVIKMTQANVQITLQKKRQQQQSLQHFVVVDEMPAKNQNEGWVFRFFLLRFFIFF